MNGPGRIRGKNLERRRRKSDEMHQTKRAALRLNSLFANIKIRFHGDIHSDWEFTIRDVLVEIGLWR